MLRSGNIFVGRVLFFVFFLTASMNHHEPLPVDKLNIAIEHGHLVR